MNDNERIFVASQSRVAVFTLSGQPQKLYSFDTYEDGFGILALSLGSSILAFPGKVVGQLHIVELPLNPIALNPATSKPFAPVVSIVPAHTSALAAIAVSSDGQLIATASVKGTLIRIFNSKTGKKICELRRGMDNAEIYSLHFNQKATRIVVASDKGTIHVFNVNAGVMDITDSIDITPLLPIRAVDKSNHASTGKSLNKSVSSVVAPMDTQPVNRQSSLAFISPFLPKYFSSEWSFAYARLPVETKCVCCFDNSVGKESVVSVGSDGSFYSLSFDQKGGEMEMDKFFWFH